VTRKDTYATKLAALALQIAPFNNKRHETLQRFMLLNDSATIAVEVPIYLTPDDFAYFRARGFTFPFGNHPITGTLTSCSSAPAFFTSSITNPTPPKRNTPSPN
jgi:hypothetical protein